MVGGVARLLPAIQVPDDSDRGRRAILQRAVRAQSDADLQSVSASGGDTNARSGIRYGDRDDGLSLAGGRARLRDAGASRRAGADAAAQPDDRMAGSDDLGEE